MPVLLDLFLTFLKVGAVSFGGGYGMISILNDEVISHGWLTNEMFINFVAVSESTPGPIAINMATFIGTSKAGFLGGIVATLGVVLPAFIIILLVASVVKGLLKFAGVKSALDYVRPVVVGLIVATGLFMVFTVILGYKATTREFAFDFKALIIFSINVLLYFVYKKIRRKSISPIFLILVSASLGIILYGIM